MTQCPYKIETGDDRQMVRINKISKIFANKSLK